MQVIPLSEGTFTIDATKAFVPFNKDTDDLQSRPRGSLLVEIQPFLVITKADYILIDTGLGFIVDGDLQIYKNLQQHGIKPEQITKVLLSHLHKDHSSGASVLEAHSGKRKLSFSKAQYYVSRAELEHALIIESLSYINEELEILQDNPQVTLLDESGTIGTTIRYALSGGHSLFHQTFWITEENVTIFFGGDVAPQLQQMRNRLIAKYDFDGRKSMELRQQWWEEGKKEGWTFLFYHDIKSPTIKAG